jgi:hypothetical protein
LDGTTYTRLDSSGPSTLKQSRAYGINGSTQVVGTWGTGTGATDPLEHQACFVWDATNGLQDLFSLVSTPGNTGWTSLTCAYSINNSGDIVGQGVRNSANHAFLLTPTTGPGIPGESKFPPPPNRGDTPAADLGPGGTPSILDTGVYAFGPSVPLATVLAPAGDTSQMPSNGTIRTLEQQPAVADLLFAAPDLQLMSGPAGWDNALFEGSLG